MTVLSALKNDFNSQIKSLQLINLICSVVGIIYLIVNPNLTYLLIATFTFLLFGIVGANAGFHRYFSHRTFETYRPVENFMAIIGTLATLGSVISWVAVHRYHHVNADTEKDPHSPRHIGWWKAYTYDWKRAEISKKFIKDIIKDPVIVFLHKNYFKVIFFYVILLLLINPWLIVFAYCIPATGCLNGVAAVTVIAHIGGYATYQTKDTARNNWFANVLSLGEGWHNNHHAHPNRWKQGELWWEIDPPSWFIRMVKK